MSSLTYFLLSGSEVSLGLAWSGSSRVVRAFSVYRALGLRV